MRNESVMSFLRPTTKKKRFRPTLIKRNNKTRVPSTPVLTLHNSED